MKNKINNFLLYHQLNQEDAVFFLSEYCKINNGREITSGELQLLLNQLANLIDWNIVVDKIAYANNISICRLYNKNGKIIQQWISQFQK